MAVLQTLDGYPDTFGAHKVSVFPHAGPAVYVRVVLAAGAAPAGGDSLLASEGGLKGFEYVNDSMTDDGIFQLWAIPNAPSTPRSGASATASCTLMWISNKTGVFGGQAQVFGTEAAVGTNLSAFTARMMALAQKS